MLSIEFKTVLIQALIIVNFFCIPMVIASDSHQLDMPGKSDQMHDYLSIDQAVERVLQFTPRLQSAANRIDAAKGAELQASYLPNPELSFEAENLGGNDDYAGTDSAEYTLSYNQKLELGGKRDARKRVAQASYAIAQDDFSIERLNVIKDVHDAYLKVLAGTESIKLVDEQQQLAEDILDNVSKRVQSAAESEIQKSKAEISLANSIILREQSDQQLQIARHNLARLWGENTITDQLDERYLFQLTEPLPYETYLVKMRDLPDIQRFANRNIQMNSLFNLAKTVGTVDPTVSVGVRRFEEGSDNAFIVGVSVPLQIFDNNQGNIAKAQAELLQTQQDAQQYEINLKQSLFENWQTWKTSYVEAVHLNNRLIPAAEKSFQLAQSAYKRGRFTYLEVLDAQRTLIEARNQYLTTLKNYHTARINVKRLTNSFGEQG